MHSLVPLVHPIHAVISKANKNWDLKELLFSDTLHS